MNDKELFKKMADLSRDAGYYSGLLEGLLLQFRKIGNVYAVDENVFKTVSTAFKNATFRGRHEAVRLE